MDDVFENQEGTMAIDDEVMKALPTTPELAKQGVDAYVEVYKALPANLKKVFLDYHWLRRLRTCFIGTTPQREADYFEEILSPADLHILIQTVNFKTDFLRFYYYSSLNKHTGENENELALLNLQAASKVVVDNSDLFPVQAIDNPAEWLLDNLSEWAQDNTVEKRSRYGLLSGFPYWAVKKYETFIALGGGVSNDWEDSGNIMGAKKVGNKAIGIYISFDEEADRKYLQELEKLYENSGIDDIAEKLRAE